MFLPAFSFACEVLVRRRPLCVLVGCVLSVCVSGAGKIFKFLPVFLLLIVGF